MCSSLALVLSLHTKQCAECAAPLHCSEIRLHTIWRKDPDKVAFTTLPAANVSDQWILCFDDYFC
jgi:hypothetical protein